MNPVKTLCFTFSLVALLAISAAAQTVYFYPPDDPKWIAGRSYISQGGKADPLLIDETTCGWYKSDGSISSSLKRGAQFWLGKPGKDRIGANGRWATDFEPGDDFDDVGGVIKLGEIFDELGGSGPYYFVADELDPNDKLAGWYRSRPAGFDSEDRCKFELAAFIYDTDPSVHPDFSCASWNKSANEGNGEAKAACDEAPAAANKKGKCIGVIKGLAKKTLDKTTKKIECDNCTKNECWSGKEEFEGMFKSTPKWNVERCYNMPFTLVTSGSSKGAFEFDSDKLRQDGSTTNTSSRLVGGFFPDILNTDAGLAQGDYSQCPNCKIKRTADRYNLIDSTKGGWEQWTTKAIYDTLVSRFYEYQSKEGDFATADVPDKEDVWRAGGWSGCKTGDGCPLYDWTCRRTASCSSNAGIGAGYNFYLYGNTAIKNTYGTTETTFKTESKANQHFCFESHAKFTYDPEQKFYFSGDDPIWVYIDNKLVIDLGGAHLAAPDHVELKTLGLTEGEDYDIDIFFCDQRTVNSNVRISTNMYIAQKSGFYNDLKIEKTNNYMCVLYQGGADCASKMETGDASTKPKDWCGPDLIKGGFKVDFYMVQRGTTDTTWLSKIPSYASSKGKRGECQDSGDNFTCYGGIKVNDAVYSCGGRQMCKGSSDATSKIIGLTGSYNVYARLVGTDGKPKTDSKPILVDQFRSETTTNIVWGHLEGESGKKSDANDAYGNLTKKDQRIIAGKRTPIYISMGAWPEGDKNYTTFIYVDDSTSAGVDYTLTVTPVGGAPANGIEVYKTKDGTEKTRSGKLKITGLDTLWVEGDFSGGTKKYELNVTANSDKTPNMTIEIYQPKLRFVDNATSTAEITASGYDRWTKNSSDPTRPPIAGTPLEIYLVAWDGDRNEICSHCNFSLKDDAIFVISGKDGNDYPLVVNSTQFKDGRLSTTFYGREATGKSDTTVTMKLTSRTSPDKTNATWTGLRFRNALVPVPMLSQIFDRNGDGIGDSVSIAYNKKLHLDSLPVLIEVVWGDSSNIRYFHVDYNGYGVADFKDDNKVKDLYTRSEFREANRKYWSKLIIKDSIIGIAVDAPNLFSKGILTASAPNKSFITSRIPFVEDGTFANTANSSALKDRIPPIVVSAKYVARESGNCANGNGCLENLTVVLSEPVYPGPDATETLIKNPFSFCFETSQLKKCSDGQGIDSLSQRLAQNYNTNNWETWEVPNSEQDYASSAIYNPSGSLNKIGSKDSIVESAYYAKEGARMPKASDWIRIRQIAAGKVFMDADSNFANPNERGVKITGTNVSGKKPIRVAKIKGGKDDPVLNGTFTDPNLVPPWFGTTAGNEAKNLFQGDRVAEFLPVPKDRSNADSVKYYFPGSVGTLFVVAEQIGSKVSDFINDCKGKDCKTANGEDLTMSNIAKSMTVNASAYYHTNLGDYTAHRDNIKVDCTNDIFKDVSGNGDCLSNGYNFYLAWDLKANSGRYVGAGAYVGISKFWLEIKYLEGGKSKTKTLEPEEFIEMFGVSRNR